MSEAMDHKGLNSRLTSARVLLVDDEYYMRKVVRTMLLGLGIRTVYEAEDGASGLALMRAHAPDAVILDWQMPGLNGPSFVRMVRSPETFPLPHSDHHAHRTWRTCPRRRSRLSRRQRVSAQAGLDQVARDRLISVLVNPRPMVSSGAYYGPMPRKYAAAVHSDIDEAVAKLIMVN